MDAQREVIDAGLLPTQVVDTDLRVGDTAVEPRLRVGLYIVSISIEFVFVQSNKFDEQRRLECWFRCIPTILNTKWAESQNHHT